MNEKLIPPNSPYWDYRMLQIINGKHRQTIADYKAERKAKLIDNIIMSVALFVSYTAIGLLIFFG